MNSIVDHPHAEELQQISCILDDNPTIIELAMQDLMRGVNTTRKGAKGMTADQVVRAFIIKQMNCFSYEDLAFHMIDSSCYRWFCRIGIADKGFKSSALCDNIKSLSAHTLQAINRQLIDYAVNNNIEKGRKARIDCTVVESNIHEPFDSDLLWDVVRVLTRNLNKAKERFGNLGVFFQDHTRRAKKRMLCINNAKNEKQRNQGYKDLLKVTRKTVNFSEQMVTALNNATGLDYAAIAISYQLEHYLELGKKVIDQTHRRVVLKETVPASEKIVSIFEPHTDIIKKDRRDTYYGHKVCLTGGASNLILDCTIEKGNPADSTLTEKMLDRQKQIYGRYPLKVALDGGFASKENLVSAKGKGIKDVCFSKKRGLKEEDMCRSKWVYKRLRNFRAGIEAGISWIKRCFGFSKCNWKGSDSFKSYVWTSIISANLLTLARHKLNQSKA